MKKNQQGATLIELMISLVLGLLVAGLAVQLFLHARHGQSSQQASAYFQESVRYAVHRLGPLLRNAGYNGCSNGYQLEVDSALHGSDFDMTRPLGGQQKTYRGHAYWALRFAMAEKPAGSNAILSQAMKSPGDTLHLDGFTGASQRTDFADAVNMPRVALVTDCDHGEVFRLEGKAPDDASASGRELTPVAPLTRTYGANPEGANPEGASGDARASSQVYPVRRWELRLRDQAGGEGRSALSLVDLDASSATKYVELVSGIQDYVVTVSLDTDGDGQIDALNQPPASLSDDSWREVVRVELAFSLRSQPGVVPGGADEGRLTRDFQLAFALRNRRLR